MSLARWAADCVERVLPVFEEAYPQDDRPRKALEKARSWARGEIPVSAARSASSDANAAARSAGEGPAKSVARAAGHAVAIAHMAGHARPCADYALKAVADGPGGAEAAAAERAWQLQQLDEDLRADVFFDLVDPTPEDSPGPA